MALGVRRQPCTLSFRHLHRGFKSHPRATFLYFIFMRSKSCLSSGLTSSESFRVSIRVILVLRHKFHNLALHNSTIVGSVTPARREDLRVSRTRREGLRA